LEGQIESLSAAQTHILDSALEDLRSQTDTLRSSLEANTEDRRSQAQADERQRIKDREADRALARLRLDLQTVREDFVTVERRLTEEFVAVQVTCDRLARDSQGSTPARDAGAAPADVAALRKQHTEEVEARRTEVDMCNEAILALAERIDGLAAQPKPVSEGLPPLTRRSEPLDRAGVAEDLNRLELRCREEIVAVQVRCDRLAREVQSVQKRLGAAPTTSTSSPDAFSTPLASEVRRA